MCRRAAYSETMQIAAPKGLLPPGIHSLSVELSVPGGQREQGAAGDIEVNNIRPREMRERLVVQSFFKVVNPWLSVFPVVGDTGSRELSRDLWGPWEGVTAPRFPLAGLQYSLLPHQAAGLGALWPGISVLRPQPGEVFRHQVGVTFDLQLVDFEIDTDGELGVQVSMQATDHRCAGFGGCPVSSRLSLADISHVIRQYQPDMATPGKVELTCVAADDCSRQGVVGLRLPPGSYRLFVRLLDSAGRQVTSERERAFSVSAGTEQTDDGGAKHASDPRRDYRGWYCDPVHCGWALDHKSGDDGGRMALLIYEWPPVAEFNGDADRVRQLIAAVASLGYGRIFVVARHCVPAQGDYLTKAPRVVGPRVTCGLTMTDIPAFLDELPPLTGADLVLMVSTFWFYPSLRSFPEIWIPFLRERAGRHAPKIVVMADVVTSPDGQELEADVHQSGEPQIHGAQLLGIAAADAVAVELPEDARWLKSLLPELPVFPVRFASTAPPLAAHAVASFATRKGLVWIGSAHWDNLKAVEFVALHVLPLVRKRVPADDGRLLVAGGGTDSIESLQGLEGVEVLGHVSDMDALLQQAKLCVSPTLYGRRRFQTKHLQALARGVPVVTTDKGAAGYHLKRLGQQQRRATAAGHHLERNSSCSSVPCHSLARGGEGWRGALFGEDREEGCGWADIREMDCLALGECCWVRDAQGGRCVREFRAYEAGQGVIVASPGITPRGESEHGSRADSGASHDAAVNEWEARLLADAVVGLLVNGDAWLTESRGALRLIQQHFVHVHLVDEMSSLIHSLHD